MKTPLFLISSLIVMYLQVVLPVYVSRAMKVVADLNHESGRLGAYRALLIGINDYKTPKIPDLNTVVNNYLCRLLGGGISNSCPY